MKIEKVLNYTIPYCGNKRIFPYGDLVVTDGSEKKTCKIKDCTNSSRQYITFNRKRYYIRNAGTLHSPKYVIYGTMDDAIELLKECNYKFEVVNEKCVIVYYKNSSDHTMIMPCDDERERYFSIEGKVQDIIDWIKRGV